MGKTYGIFTKPIHVEKIVNYLNLVHPKLNYIISTDKQEVDMWAFEIGVSYCFPYKIDMAKQTWQSYRVWYNYHPGPLPEYPGLTNYSMPIRDGVTRFGVTLHKMTDEIDKGPIIKRIDFDLASPPTSTNELGNIAHYYLFQLFKETIWGLGDV